MLSDAAADAAGPAGLAMAARRCPACCPVRRRWSARRCWPRRRGAAGCRRACQRFCHRTGAAALHGRGRGPQRRGGARPGPARDRRADGHRGHRRGHLRPRRAAGCAGRRGTWRRGRAGKPSALQGIARDIVEPARCRNTSGCRPRCAAAERAEVRYAVRHPELGQRWLLTRVEPGALAGGRRATSVVTLDVTDHERAQRRNEQLLRELTHHPRRLDRRHRLPARRRAGALQPPLRAHAGPARAGGRRRRPRCRRCWPLSAAGVSRWRAAR